MIVHAYSLLLTLLLHHRWHGATVAANADGWKMTDRFSGFRYELHDTAGATGGARAVTKESIRAMADRLFCFGWTQDSKERGTIVGEIRCSRRNGAVAKNFLAGPFGDGRRVSFRDYEDTKIRLHFSHFKIIGDGRETCFRDEPHRCDDLSATESLL